MVLTPFPGTGPVLLHPVLAAARPPERIAQGGFRVLPVAGIRGALVKQHGNVTAQVRLDLHGTLRTQHHVRAVQMVLEAHPFLRNLAELGKGPDLETAGIRQNGAVPGGKPVQAAHFPDQGGTGTQGQMVGIPQNNPCPQRLQILRMHGFHGTLRSHRHEDGGGNPAVRQIKRAQARSRGGIFLVKCKRHRNQAFCNLMKRAR